ncbi:MAG: RluA family pseudouridine synthase [bacterium]|nr:RluA family pseudouridine synthase [bacterium]
MVPEEYYLERVDKFLIHALELDLSRSYIQKLIKNGDILVNNSGIKQNYKVKTDDEITIRIPEPVELELLPEDIPLDILYEDSSIAVINKQPNLVVHPGPGNWSKTLVNALLFHIKDLSSIGGVIRPGIVHRLDKDTSGLMVIAKNDTAHKNLVEQFANRTVKKRYAALVQGKPKDEHAVIDQPIGRHHKYRHKMTVTPEGKEAVSEIFLKKIWNLRTGMFSLLDVKIHTGRTHQVRVHLSYIGNSIVGDPIYSKRWAKYKVPYLLLVSKYLGFTHPETKKEMEFEVPLPEHVTAFAERLDKREKSGAGIPGAVEEEWGEDEG